MMIIKGHYEGEEKLEPFTTKKGVVVQNKIIGVREAGMEITKVEVPLDYVPKKDKDGNVEIEFLISAQVWKDGNPRPTRIPVKLYVPKK